MSEQKKSYWKKWAQAALIRAAKTFFQTALSGIVIGAAFSDINWTALFSVAGVAFVASIFTSLAGLPEVEKEGDPE